MQWAIATINPFIAINCGAIPESLIKQLIRTWKGALQRASRSIFTTVSLNDPKAVLWPLLDEVDSLSPAAQNQIASWSRKESGEGVGGSKLWRLMWESFQQQIRIWKDLLKQDMFRNDHILSHQCSAFKYSSLVESDRKTSPYLEMQLIIQDWISDITNRLNQ